MRNEIKVTRTAHYYTIEPNNPIETILYAIHGYAQLAGDFIKQFEYLIDSNTLVVAPEGLSIFYGRDRTPVSSWMTSHERDDEIKDHVNYLNQLHIELKSRYQFQKIKILGFSQGSSTAFRWIKSLNESNIQLHICSGSIPPEITNKNLNKNLEQVYFYYGENDRLMKPEHAEKAIKHLNELDIKKEIILFKGRHEISDKTHDLLKR